MRAAAQRPVRKLNGGSGSEGAREGGRRDEGEEDSWKKMDHKRAIFLSLGRTCGSYKGTHSHPPLYSHVSKTVVANITSC